jgi:hypothetical protein
MMKPTFRSVALLAPLLLDACSEPSEPPNVAYIDCLFNAAETLDDGVSDIQTVAPRVDAACEAEKLEMVRTLLEEQGEVASGELLQSAMKAADMSARIVSAVRADRNRGEPASQSAP